ncbi:glycoside hydrolase family 16 protein [Moniliophthora roreri]|nr:glycoside hydrolase family 16 protein [Moniliophthora roreri]
MSYPKRDLESGTYLSHSPSTYSHESRERQGNTIRAGHFASRPPSIRSFSSNGSHDSPYSVSAAPGRQVPSINSSIAEKYSLSADPREWGTSLSPSFPEPDDKLHNPDPVRDRKNDSGRSFLTRRGFMNLGCMIALILGLLSLFAIYPIYMFIKNRDLSNVRGVNATGQPMVFEVPVMLANTGLVDIETPEEARTIKAYHTGVDMELVFSDEFNRDGRSFYPGDDPYWEAVDLHYWQTNNMEWYDPAAITTKNGALEITLSRMETHDLNYQGGMMSTWNKFCFTGGMFLASVSLPGISNIAGLWPAVWAMGNLGRAGYGASLEGMWPYTYDECDVGTVKNQTIGGKPEAARFNSPSKKEALSFLPGQRLSRCTCPGEDHPGPIHTEDGTFVGRSAPEIDVIEAQVSDGIGAVSQSGQWGPFDFEYRWKNTTDGFEIYDETITEQNSYLGGTFQEATSCVTQTSCFSVYGFEYKPGFDDAYITWISDGKKSWTMFANAVGQNDKVGISARPVPQEPMYLIVNLGMSTNFGDVDLEHLIFPTTMRIDWIRVYQEKGKKNVGCDPEDFPTKAYIDKHIRAYSDANLTTWVDDFKQPFPKNKLLGQC